MHIVYKLITNPVLFIAKHVPDLTTLLYNTNWCNRCNFTEIKRATM